MTNTETIDHAGLSRLSSSAIYKAKNAAIQVLTENKTAFLVNHFIVKSTAQRVLKPYFSLCRTDCIVPECNKAPIIKNLRKRPPFWGGRFTLHHRHDEHQCASVCALRSRLWPTPPERCCSSPDG